MNSVFAIVGVALIGVAIVAYEVKQLIGRAVHWESGEHDRGDK